MGGQRRSGVGHPGRPRQREVLGVEREVRAVPRVEAQGLAPATLHVADLLCEPRRPWTVVGAPADRLVVEELGVRAPDDPPSRLAQPQAEVDVVEGDRQVRFVEAPSSSHASRRTRVHAAVTAEAVCATWSRPKYPGDRRSAIRCECPATPRMPRTTPACWIRPSS